MTYFSGDLTRGKRGLAGVLGLAVFAVALSVGAPAFSQDADLKPLLDRIQRLERDIRTLNAQVARGGSGSGEPVPLVSGPEGGSLPAAETEQTLARLELRMTNLENELRAATGRSEEVSHQVDLVNERLDKLIADVDYRLSALERSVASGQTSGSGPAAGEPNVASNRPSAAIGGGGPARTAPARPTEPGTLGTLSEQDARNAQGLRADEMAASPQDTDQRAATEAPTQQAAATGGVLPEGTPRDQYNYAFGLLRQTRYEEAEAALTAFLDTHGDHPLASNARYWLGESYYVRGDYVRAAEVFLDAYQDAPKGPKAPDTLLKLGMSLSSLDKKREACAAFGKLANEYDDAPANIKRLVERERSRNACN